MPAKQRRVVADTNSLEIEALRRSYNSLLLILQNIAAEEAAATTTSVQAASALSNALLNGIDSSSAPHVGTGRLVYGINPTPLHPARGPIEDVVRLDVMVNSDKF